MWRGPPSSSVEPGAGLVEWEEPGRPAAAAAGNAGINSSGLGSRLS